jgi:hypothetical protein
VWTISRQVIEIPKEVVIWAGNPLTTIGKQTSVLLSGITPPATVIKFWDEDATGMRKII